MKNSINLHDKYIPLFKSKTRYNVITGGRGSGKSFGINVFSTKPYIRKWTQDIVYSLYNVISQYIYYTRICRKN